MHVILADPGITIQGWPTELDYLGEYTLKVRKTPEELKQEKEQLTRKYGAVTRRLDNIKRVVKTIFYRQEAKPDTVYFQPGAWPRIKHALQDKGYDYSLADERSPIIRPRLNLEKLKGVQFRENQDVALALIESEDYGIIETATAWGKSFCISLICKAMDTLNILVCTSSSSVVQTIYGYLNEQLPGEIGVICGTKNTAIGKRVIVSTLKSLSKIPSEEPQQVLIDEVHDVGDNLAGKELARFCFARRFGFSASPIRNDGSALMLEALCGPTIQRMTYEQSVEAGMVVPMKYTMLSCTKGMTLDAYKMNDVTLKRLSYWCNSYRNKVIANFVYDLKKVSDCQILIIVGTLEHAIRQHQLLPWFVVAYYGGPAGENISKRFPKEKYPNLDLSKYKMTQKKVDIIRAAFCKGSLRYVIATSIFKQGINAVHLKVLIRADGATSDIWGIQIPGRLARLDEGKSCAYLVDVMDSFSPWAKKRSERRMQLYDQQQWQYIGREEVQDDLKSESGEHDQNDAWNEHTEEHKCTEIGG